MQKVKTSMPLDGSGVDVFQQFEMTLNKSKRHQILDLTAANFKETVIESRKPFVIQIQAEWCGECFIMSSLLNQLLPACADRLTFAVVNIDSNQQIAEHYGVTELPFLLFFNDGQLVDFLIGLHSKKTIQGYIEKIFGSEQ